MKFLLCLLLYLCVNLSYENKIPNKYKDNPFLMQMQQKPNRTNNNNNNNSTVTLSAPFLSREQLAIKYAHNPFLSQLFNPTTQTSISGLTNNRFEQTIRNHRNFNLLPSRDTCGYEGTFDRIGFGQEAAIGQFPWMVLLEYRIKRISIGYKCAGALISDRYVLTAAHCIRAKSMPSSEKLFKVRLGDHDIYKIRDCDAENDCNDPPVDITVAEIITHEDYDVDNKNFHHDIALLRLHRKISPTNFIKPICLPFDGEKTKPGVHMNIAGWGLREDDDSLSNVKMVATVPYIRDSECTKFWKSANINIIENQFCAGGMSRTNACKGDSGGPIMSTFKGMDQWYAEGIISFGNSECGGDPYPTVYTRVSSYIKWILDNIKK